MRDIYDDEGRREGRGERERAKNERNGSNEGGGEPTKRVMIRMSRRCLFTTMSFFPFFK